MDAQWLGVMVAAAAVTVSLAALILSGLRGIREEVRSLSRQQREDRSRLEDVIAIQTRQQRDDQAKVTEKLSEIAERTARIEGILVSQGLAEFRTTAAQAVPDEPPDDD